MKLQRTITLLLGSLFLASALLPIFQARVYALSAAQKKVYDSGVKYYDIEGGSSGSCSINLVGSENAEKIWNYLRSKGLTAIATAALLGNIQAESGFSPTSTNSKSGAYGIVQWWGGRLTRLQAFANDQGVPISDLGLQLEFMWGELSGSYKSSITDVINATDATIESATQLVYDYYEGLKYSGQGSVEERTRYARDLLARFGNGEVGGSGTTCGEQGESTAGSQIVGNVGDDSDKILCAPGTESLGVVNTYNGKLKTSPAQYVKMRICKVNNFRGVGEDASGKNIGYVVVNSRASGAVFAMKAKADKEGISLIVSSSFRTQQNCSGGSDKCAEQGKSYHQLGIALDFGDIYDSVGGDAGECNPRQTSPLASWKWLAANAWSNFGFKQYCAEAWQWDASNDSNRVP